jgi:uncharacterized membrane protein YcgQ (UPF0703/DUF1980 family)
MKKIYVLVMVFLIFLSACSPSVTAIETTISNTEAAKPTQTAYPTYTIIPTYTPYPTHTPYPTYTQAPTQTPKVIVVTLTNTPTQTLTPTPIKSPTSTLPPTNTLQSWQLTQEVAKKTQVYLQEFEQVNVRDFITYPDKFKGKKIKLSGSIFNINGNDEFQIFISGTSEAAYIISREPFDDLYENNYVTIYGFGNGEDCFKNVYNAEICQPMVDAVIIQK